MEGYQCSAGNSLEETSHCSLQRTAFDAFLQPAGLYSLGEACIRGDVDPHNIETIISHLVKNNAVPCTSGMRAVTTLCKVLFGRPQLGKGAYEVAYGHYDLGNDLFESMLDPSMSYTCGYWKESADLESAQKMKLDILCKKLKLAPGMRVLDIGCGWGNFAHYAATNYKVSVTGLTVSKEQAVLARQRCAGLPVEILLQSYESFKGSFDRVVSIEMIEAVGKRNLGRYFSTIHHCLKPGGIAAIQAISAESFSIRSHRGADQFLAWLMKYIFPNGYVPNAKELMQPSALGLVVEDVENISTDYEKTLRAWRQNFQAAWPTLRQKYGDSFYRMWLYYLGGCIAFFQLRMAQVYQIVYAKEGIPGGYARI